MNKGIRALLSGFVAFVGATATVLVVDRDSDVVDAMTIGGLAGGTVALRVWFGVTRGASRDDGTDD